MPNNEPNDFVQYVADPGGVFSKGGDMPETPDPYETAAADFAFSNFNQNTPFGSLNFTAPEFGPDGEVLNTASSNLTLTPEMQAMFDSQLGITQTSLNQAQQLQSQLDLGGIDMTGVPDFQSGFDVQDFSGVRDDIFGQMSGLINANRDTEQDKLLQRLANQGIDQGGRAYNNDLYAFNRNYDDQITQAALGATLSAGQEQSRQAGLSQAQAGFNNNSRSAQIAEMLGLNSYDFNQIQALLGQQQVTVPGLNNFFSPAGSDFGGAQGIASAQANQNFANEQANYQAAMGGGAGILSSIIAK
jgi:hypothetical protein